MRHNVLQIFGIRTGVSYIQEVQTSIHHTRVPDYIVQSSNLGVALQIRILTVFYGLSSGFFAMENGCNQPSVHNAGQYVDVTACSHLICQLLT